MITTTEEYLKGIQENFDEMERRLNALKQENAKLKDEHYKDKELQKMKAEVDEAHEALMRGFAISEGQAKAISEWTKKHRDTHHPNLSGKLRKSDGCMFEYIFVPTPIETGCYIECKACKKMHPAARSVWQFDFSWIV